MRKPTILIVTEDGFDGSFGARHFVISRAYGDMVAACGGIPVVAADIRALDEYAARFDGLLLTGGGRIQPAWYGEIVENFGELDGYSNTRDDFDFGLFRRFHAAGKPVLGIGRGAEVINVALGGTLLKHLPEGIRKGDRTEEDLGGRLAEILGDRLETVRDYDTAIAQLAEGLSPEATAETGLVDGFSDASGKILGVLWHPERAHEIEDGKGVIPADERIIRAWIEGIKSEEKEGLNVRHHAGQNPEKPLILVNGGSALDRQFLSKAFVTNKTYSEAVAAGGAVPVISASDRSFSDYADLCDGMILTGSFSFMPDPARRDEVQDVEGKERPKTDEALLDAFVRVRKPCFGICLGLQRMNTYFGGTLHPYFKKESGIEHMMTFHLCEAGEHSVTRPLFGEEFYINSRHNVKIGVLADSLEATAFSPDGVIEEIRHKELPVWGVQYHPERMRQEHREPPEGPDMTPLFVWFADVCRENHERQEDTER